MKKPFIVAGLTLLTAWFLFGQGLSAPARGVTSAQTVATCPTPVAGMSWYCDTYSGPYFSFNGTAYVALPIIATPGITGITVNGGSVQTGPTVSLTVPTKAISTTTTTIQ
jgi:hypothetical protein